MKNPISSFLNWLNGYSDLSGKDGSSSDLSQAFPQENKPSSKPAISSKLEKNPFIFTPNIEYREFKLDLPSRDALGLPLIDMQAEKVNDDGNCLIEAFIRGLSAEKREKLVNVLSRLDIQDMLNTTPRFERVKAIIANKPSEDPKNTLNAYLAIFAALADKVPGKYTDAQQNDARTVARAVVGFYVARMLAHVSTLQVFDAQGYRLNLQQEMVEFLINTVAEEAKPLKNKLLTQIRTILVNDDRIVEAVLRDFNAPILDPLDQMRNLNDVLQAIRSQEARGDFVLTTAFQHFSFEQISQLIKIYFEGQARANGNDQKFYFSLSTIKVIAQHLGVNLIVFTENRLGEAVAGLLKQQSHMATSPLRDHKPVAIYYQTNHGDLVNPDQLSAPTLDVIEQMLSGTGARPIPALARAAAVSRFPAVPLVERPRVAVPAPDRVPTPARGDVEAPLESDDEETVPTPERTPSPARAVDVPDAAASAAKTKKPVLATPIDWVMTDQGDEEQEVDDRHKADAAQDIADDALSIDEPEQAPDELPVDEIKPRVSDLVPVTDTVDEPSNKTILIDKIIEVLRDQPAGLMLARHLAEYGLYGSFSHLADATELVDVTGLNLQRRLMDRATGKYPTTLTNVPTHITKAHAYAQIVDRIEDFHFEWMLLDNPFDDITEALADNTSGIAIAYNKIEGLLQKINPNARIVKLFQENPADRFEEAFRLGPNNVNVFLGPPESVLVAWAFGAKHSLLTMKVHMPARITLPITPGVRTRPVPINIPAGKDTVYGVLHFLLDHFHKNNINVTEQEQMKIINEIMSTLLEDLQAKLNVAERSSSPAVQALAGQIKRDIVLVASQWAGLYNMNEVLSVGTDPDQHPVDKNQFASLKGLFKSDIPKSFDPTTFVNALNDNLSGSLTAREHDELLGMSGKLAGSMTEAASGTAPTRPVRLADEPLNKYKQNDEHHTPFRKRGP